MNRPFITALLSIGLSGGIASSAVAQAKHQYQPVHGAIRVDETNVPFEAQLEPTKMPADSSSIQIGGDSWAVKGVGLKTLIATIYDMDERRVEIPEGMDGDARYDLSLSLPVELDQDSMQTILAKAIEQKFGVTLQRETRPMDVYVLSAPNGPGDGLHRRAFAHKSAMAKMVALATGDDDASGRITYMGRDCSGVTSGGITVQGGTIAEFQRTLEPDLDRVLLDETHLSGSYDFKIGMYVNQDQLFQLLQAQLGLVVRPEQRSVTVLTVRPAGLLEAKL